MSAKPSFTALVPVTAAVIALAACGSKGDADTAAAGDSAATTTATSAGQTAPSGTAGDSAMGGMDHSNMAGMNMSRSAPRDSNQVFLRMMSDHHEGLITLADSAQARLQGATAKADAQKLRGKQDEEQTRMLSMLTRQYSDSITPMIMPSNRAMIDSVARAPQGAEADRVFYRQVIAHHREGIHHAEMHLPHLTGDVKQMAEKMRADQQREIQELERKARSGG